MLELCKLLLRKLYLLPLATSTLKQVISVLHYVLNLTIEAVLLVGTLKYALQHIEDIDDATEPAFASFAFATSMFVYIWMISKRRTICLAIDHLEKYVNESKNVLRQK